MWPSHLPSCSSKPAHVVAEAYLVRLLWGPLGRRFTHYYSVYLARAPVTELQLISGISMKSFREHRMSREGGGGKLTN